MGHRRKSHWRARPGNKGGVKDVYVRGTTVNDSTEALGAGDDGGCACLGCLVVLFGVGWCCMKVWHWIQTLFN